MAHVILLEHIIFFPCLSEYRHQPIPAHHIPCTAWNITFISMICHFLHNTCRTSDGSAGGWPRTWAGICKCRGVTISDPDCSITVCVMFWFAYFSVVFCIHEIYIRRRNNGVWGSRYVISMYRTLIIQLCQGKYSFPFYGTFKTCFFWVLNNDPNTSNLTSANISKSRCMIHFNTLLPYILRLKGKLLQMHFQ